MIAHLHREENLWLLKETDNGLNFKGSRIISSPQNGQVKECSTTSTLPQTPVAYKWSGKNSGTATINPWLANIAATRRIGPVTWKISEYGSRPGYRPSVASRKRYVRIGPVDIWISTDSIFFIIIPFSDVHGIDP
jgi:hypothetical protein